MQLGQTRNFPPKTPSIQEHLAQLRPMAHEAPVQTLAINSAHAYSPRRLFTRRTMWLTNSTSQAPGAPRDQSLRDDRTWTGSLNPCWRGGRARPYRAPEPRHDAGEVVSLSGVRPSHKHEREAKGDRDEMKDGGERGRPQHALPRGLATSTPHHPSPYPHP
eukprot:5645299-Pyramimonas_sp.AAC.1